MKQPNFSDPQFVDALGPGGLNAAFGTISGSIASVNRAAWATESYPGLVDPQAMTTSFSGMTANVGLPNPWALVTSGGVLVRAHGTVTNQDTVNYSANFSGLLPASGSRTAYLVASVVQIQQDPVPIPGPPLGHPNFNPNFVPTISYASNVYSVAVTATSGAPDNFNTFELFRTTLTPGQSVLSVINTVGQQGATLRLVWPNIVLPTGGNLTTAQAQVELSPAVPGLTHTLPPATGAGGLVYNFVNPTSGNWTIASAGADRIVGITNGNATSVVIPTSGAMSMYGDAAAGAWIVNAFNSQINAYWNNNQIFKDTVQVSGASAAGARLWLRGNGATTPDKMIRAINGILDILNSALNQEILTLTDGGALSLPLAGLTAHIGARLTAAGVSPAVLLNDYTVNSNGNGVYVIFPNGVIIQAGNRITLTGNGDVYNWPIAWPNAVWGLGCSDDGTGMSSMGMTAWAGSPKAAYQIWSGWQNGFGITPTYAGGIGINWVAVGN